MTRGFFAKFFILCSLPLTGCIRVAPRMPRTIAAPAPIAYTAADLDRDVDTYRKLAISGSTDLAMTERNSIIYRVMTEVDLAYGRFEGSLSTGRAGAQTAGDAAQLGMTAAATVVGATEIKDILSATSTAFQGTRLSFDKNFFEQKTTEALVSQMRASRKTLKAQLLRSLAGRPVMDYPLEAAWADVIEYYYAGTIPSALIDIASKAGADATAANGTLQDAVRDLTPETPEQERKAISVRSAYTRLSRDLDSQTPSVASAAVEKLRMILGAMGTTPDVSTSNADLLARMREVMKKAAKDHDLLDKLQNAVQAAMQP